VVVNLAWTTAFFFGVPVALEDRSAGPQKEGKISLSERSLRKLLKILSTALTALLGNLYHSTAGLFSEWR
jgi:hypothetical protein